MPVREMVYDAMNYAGQVKALSDKHRKRKDYRDGAEFLSGLLREDRLAPVVTICFYYGTGKWEGPLDLFDMLDIPEEYEDMKPFMTNYKVNLVQASNVAPDNFRTDLRHVFSLLGMAADGAGMKRYIQERPEEFRHISYETFDCLRELLHVDKWWKTDGFERKGEVDMCKALEEIAEMAKDEGKAEGVRVGIKALAEICEKLGVPFEQTVEMVTEKFGMSSEAVSYTHLNCVPGLLFALAVVAALGSSMRNLLIAVTIVSLPGFIRIVRSVILSIVEQEYICLLYTSRCV